MEANAMNGGAGNLVAPIEAAGTAAATPPQGVPDSLAAQPPQKIDLTSFPEFRNFQANADKRLAEEQAQRARLEQRLASLENQQQAQTLAQLDSLDPADANKQLRKMLEDRAAAERNAAETQRMTQAAVQAVQAAGLDWNDPRLTDAKTLGATQQGVSAIQQTVIAILSADRAAARAAGMQQATQQAQQVTQVTQRAVSQALTSAGVPLTSGAPSVVSPMDPAAQEKAAFREKFRTLQHAGGDHPLVIALRDQLREKGWTLGDL